MWGEILELPEKHAHRLAQSQGRFRGTYAFPSKTPLGPDFYFPVLKYETQAPWFLNSEPSARVTTSQPDFLQSPFV